MIGLLRQLVSGPDPYQKALDAIRECMQSGETKLSLSRYMLGSIPPEIGQLTNLRELRIHRNPLTSRPPEIGQLTNLENRGANGYHVCNHADEQDEHPDLSAAAKGSARRF